MVDALASGASISNDVEVQVLSSAPRAKNEVFGGSERILAGKIFGTMLLRNINYLATTPFHNEYLFD